MILVARDAVVGLACGCACFGCDRQLIARNGGEVCAHSFAHRPKDMMVDCFSARLRRLYSSVNLLLERFGMYQIAIDRVSGGLRVMRSLREMGDVFTLRNILDRNEEFYRQNANEDQLREFEEIQSAVMSMTEKEAREGVGACLDLLHPSVVNAYNRPVPRIVAIVDKRGGLI